MILNSNNAIKDPRRGRISSFTRYQQRVGGSHGLHLPSFRNGLNENFENCALESAYQRYSRRQRQKSLIVVNAIDAVLKLATIILISVDYSLEKSSPTSDKKHNFVPKCWNVANTSKLIITEDTNKFDFPLSTVIGTSFLIIINILICNIVFFWRWFANNHLHWAAIATEIFMNIQGKFGKSVYLYINCLTNKCLFFYVLVLIGLGYDNILYFNNNERANMTTHMVWYIMFIIFATYAFFPLPLLWALSAAILTSVIHLILFIGVRYSSERLISPWEVNNVFFYTCV